MQTEGLGEAGESGGTPEVKEEERFKTKFISTVLCNREV